MVSTRKEHRVTFYSPGSIVSEETTKPIGGWDARAAAGMAEEVVERHGAKPYAFRFSTVIVADPISDGHGGTMPVAPKHVKSSGLYHLGGTVETYAQVVARNAADEDILRSNMRCNEWWAIVVNTNSYKSVHPFQGGDVLVDAAGEIVDRASRYTAEVVD